MLTGVWCGPHDHSRVQAPLELKTAAASPQKLRNHTAIRRYLIMATRSASWSDKEVRALITEWSEEKIQEELEGSTRNKDIFVKIAAGLKKQGYARDWKHCRDEIKKN